tara:strand:+ start:1575 stop:2246 length:672 start_codon:yes stop_codon:yes gene_type:complete
MIVDKSINKLTSIQENIKKISTNNLIKTEIVCVSKTFSIDVLWPLINHGHFHFGENKVQEAEKKWRKIKEENSNLKLHMVGKLQSNKAKKAVQLFDFIHSLDNIKLADVLKKGEVELNKKLSYFIQINVGDESQKAGIPLDSAKDFLKYCSNEIKLNVIGLMIIPPNDNNPDKYFEKVSKLNSNLGLKHLSMGMSSDYEVAVKFGSTFLRIGSAILGERNTNK